MWEPNGKLVDPEPLGSLRPVEVLYEFDGEYLTYLASDRNDDPLLVHNLCVFEGISRYVVSPIDSRILGDLKAGRIDVYSALQQPRCWVADLVPSEGAEPPWRIQSLYRVEFENLPGDHLPIPGTMLTPDLDPLFRIRLIGSGVGPGKTTAADVRMAAQAAELGLRGLARIALDEKKQVGRIPRDIRHYSDLPYQFARAASFEIAFGRPLDMLPDVDDEVFNEMGRLLERGLNALRANGDDLAPIEGLSSEQALQLFEAIKALTPPTRGGVDRVEVGGGLIERLAVSKVLTRDDRSRSVQRIKATRKVPRKEAPFRVSGVIEEADQGTSSFTLRKLEPQTLPVVDAMTEIGFRFEDHLYDAVMDAFNSLERMVVVGERIDTFYQALDVQVAVDVSPSSPEPEASGSE
ncbi:MAG: hypothetical protein ACXWPK_05690 [Isosphaeraceae bacterium]